MVVIMWLLKALYQIYKIMNFKMSYIIGHTACCYYPLFSQHSIPVTLWLLQKCGFETDQTTHYSRDQKAVTELSRTDSAT